MSVISWGAFAFEPIEAQSRIGLFTAIPIWVSDSPPHLELQPQSNPQPCPMRIPGVPTRRSIAEDVLCARIKADESTCTLGPMCVQ